ncbi:MAG: DnaD domain protein [Bacillota bacterium]
MKYMLKELIDEHIISYERLVLKYYHKFNLTEQEAIALIKLHTLLDEEEAIINPKKFSKWLSTQVKETEAILDSLMTKGYLKIKLITMEDDKEKEVFDIDFFLSKVVDYLEKKASETHATVTYEWVQYLEDSLQKSLTPLDIEIITSWIENDKYSFEMVKEATLEALKHKNPSVRLIDQKLLHQLESIKINPKKKDVLKEFHALWDE